MSFAFYIIIYVNIPIWEVICSYSITHLFSQEHWLHSDTLSAADSSITQYLKYTQFLQLYMIYIYIKAVVLQTQTWIVFLMFECVAICVHIHVLVWALWLCVHWHYVSVACVYIIDSYIISLSVTCVLWEYQLIIIIKLNFTQLYYYIVYMHNYIYRMRCATGKSVVSLYCIIVYPCLPLMCVRIWLCSLCSIYRGGMHGVNDHAHEHVGASSCSHKLIH